MKFLKLSTSKTFLLIAAVYTLALIGLAFYSLDAENPSFDTDKNSLSVPVSPAPAAGSANNPLPKKPETSAKAAAPLSLPENLAEILTNLKKGQDAFNARFDSLEEKVKAPDFAALKSHIDGVKEELKNDMSSLVESGTLSVPAASGAMGFTPGMIVEKLAQIQDSQKMLAAQFANLAEKTDMKISGLSGEMGNAGRNLENEIRLLTYFTYILLAINIGLVAVIFLKRSADASPVLSMIKKRETMILKAMRDYSQKEKEFDDKILKVVMYYAQKESKGLATALRAIGLMK